MADTLGSFVRPGDNLTLKPLPVHRPPPTTTRRRLSHHSPLRHTHTHTHARTTRHHRANSSRIITLYNIIISSIANNTRIYIRRLQRLYVRVALAPASVVATEHNSRTAAAARTRHTLPPKTVCSVRKTFPISFARRVHIPRTDVCI